MKVKGEIINPHVYSLTFDTKYELCMSFVRMQEFYESQKFRNKYFTLEEFIDYWANEFGHGTFDYPARWNGFNLPSNVVSKWTNLFFDHMREREETILNEIGACRFREDNVEQNGKYYVIGVHAESSEESRLEVVEHETAHAFYYIYPAYKRAVNKLLGELPKKEYGIAEKKLFEMGYGKNVAKDEMQAYFSTNMTFVGDKTYPLSGRREFSDCFKSFKSKIK